MKKYILCRRCQGTGQTGIKCHPLTCRYCDGVKFVRYVKAKKPDIEGFYKHVSDIVNAEIAKHEQIKLQTPTMQGRYFYILIINGVCCGMSAHLQPLRQVVINEQLSKEQYKIECYKMNDQLERFAYIETIY